MNMTSGDITNPGAATGIQPSSTTPYAPAQPASSGCGCGCLKFLLKGCLVIIIIALVVTIWNRFPSFQKPQSARYELWPEKTTKASSMLTPKDRRKMDEYTESHYFFPVKEMPRWFAAAHIRAEDVRGVTLLKTIQSEDFRLEGENIYFDSIASHVMLVDLNRSARDILNDIPASIAMPEKRGTTTVLVFDAPAGGPNAERWYWAAPTDRTLAIGGRAAVEQVLAIAAGDSEGITGRRVLRPILKDLEGANMIELDLIPTAREASMGVGRQIAKFFQSIPGLSMLFAIRGQAVALEKLPSGACIQKQDYQFNGRLPALAVWAFFRLASEKPEALASTGKPEEVPEEVLVERDGGLVKIHMRYGAERCRAVENTGERVQLFVH